MVEIADGPPGTTPAPGGAVRLPVLLALLAAAAGPSGCGAAAGGGEGDVPTKDDVLTGKDDGSGWCWLLGADPGCDVCEELGWYGDGDCDHLLVDAGICHRIDPDCPPPGCFEAHLQDAIALNQARSPGYAAASGGRSSRISSRLITGERVTLPVARWLDGRAVPWQDAGVALLCDDLVGMDQAPAFVARQSPPPPGYVRVDGAAVAARLTTAFAAGGYDRLRAAVADQLAAIAGAPAYHCMLRHLLDSTLRAANLAPVHETEAAGLGLASPHALSRDFVLAQLGGIALATGVDDDAAPLQAEGIPIICNDVPPIPPGP